MGSTSRHSSSVKVTRMLQPHQQSHEPKGGLLFEYFIVSTLVCALNKRFVEKGKEGNRKTLQAGSSQQGKHRLASAGSNCVTAIFFFSPLCSYLLHIHTHMTHSNQ